MPLDRPLPDDTREALKMLWDVGAEQQVDINRHRDSLHKVWHVAPVKPREGMLVYADGVHWNPGSGAGYYEYVGGAWMFMGAGATGPAGPPGATGPAGPTGPPGASTIIQEEGVPLTSRTTLNFIGTSVTAADDAANSRTNVTITGASQTPWLSNIDGANFSLTNVSILGIGTATPVSKLSLGATATIANRIAVYEAASGANFYGIGLALAGGFGTAIWADATVSDSSYHTIFYANGHLGIGTGATGPAHRLTVIPMAAVNTLALAAQQVAIGEGSNNTGYRLTFGYGVQTGSRYCGVVQSWENTGVSPLYLNASGGGVCLGHQTDLSATSGAAIANGTLNFFFRDSDNQLFIQIKRTDGTYRTAQITTT